MLHERRYPEYDAEAGRPVQKDYSYTEHRKHSSTDYQEEFGGSRGIATHEDFGAFEYTTFSSIQGPITAVFEADPKYKSTIEIVLDEEAEEAGCTGYVVGPSEIVEWGGEYIVFRATCKAAEGWKFKQWSLMQGMGVIEFDPYDEDLVVQVKTLDHDEKYVFKPIFYREEYTIKLHCSLSDSAEKNGCWCSPDQSWTGHLGETHTFEVWAGPGLHCAFSRWMRDGVELSKEEDYSLTLTFGIDTDVEIVAKFKLPEEGSGLPIYENGSGSILASWSGARILYEEYRLIPEK